MSLNAEPSLPTEREAAHLAPKTYKDAVLEYSPPEDDKASSPVMADQTNGTNGAHVAPNGTIDVNEKGTASVLRIVSTHGEGNGESNGRANEDKSGLEEEEPEFGDQNREVSQDTCVSIAKISHLCNILTSFRARTKLPRVKQCPNRNL